MKWPLVVKHPDPEPYTISIRLFGERVPARCEVTILSMNERFYTKSFFGLDQLETIANLKPGAADYEERGNVRLFRDGETLGVAVRSTIDNAVFRSFHAHMENFAEFENHVRDMRATASGSVAV